MNPFDVQDNLLHCPQCEDNVDFHRDTCRIYANSIVQLYRCSADDIDHHFYIAAGHSDNKHLIVKLFTGIFDTSIYDKRVSPTFDFTDGHLVWCPLCRAAVIPDFTTAETCSNEQEVPYACDYARLPITCSNGHHALFVISENDSEYTHIAAAVVNIIESITFHSSVCPSPVEVLSASSGAQQSKEYLPDDPRLW